MSDSKRTTLITVGAPNSVKNNVNKTVRLTINLDESNESKYSELNYKELVIAEERKKRVVNGKTTGLDPFSDNDDDVERVAKKFEQKYGGKSTYGRKGRSKHDDFADIGAGYDENDSFIDNTHGYDEMIPPECDTLYGGFYINSGSLEFKNVDNNQSAHSDGEMHNRRNKRRISSSSSEEDSSESSSESESQDEKDPKAIANGTVDSHKTEHRKKKNKKIEKKKAKKVRRADSSAATSGKQTSDDNAHGDAESADSRTSQSDSLASKPAPSSENAITSDSSRDTEAKTEVKLPAPVLQVLEALEALDAAAHPAHPAPRIEPLVLRLERVMSKSGCVGAAAAAARARAQRALSIAPREYAEHITASNSRPTVSSSSNKRKVEDDDDFDVATMSEKEREAKIVETLQRLKTLIDERKPEMISTYNAECERVQEERKKLVSACGTEGGRVEKRLPKRRFPWCARARSLLARLTRLAPAPRDAALLLAHRALPLFPNGFVRMPTLLRQADLSKEIKMSEIKRQRLGSCSTSSAAAPAPAPAPLPASFPEPIQFPSSLTVTATVKSTHDKPDSDDKYKQTTPFGHVLNAYNKEIPIEKPDKKDTDKIKEEFYVPSNNIGSITITAVPSQKDKKNNVDKHTLIRVKSPAALNEMVNKKDKVKKPEKNHVKEKADQPLHIDTSYQLSKKDPSPKTKDEIPQKQIENMRVAENNIPRPGLVPVHHSPTFAKPDKRPELKKKKEILIVSDVDPLGDTPNAEPLAVDDSSSDVEVIEDSKTNKCETKLSDNKCDPVPLDNASSREPSAKKLNSVKIVPKEVVKDTIETVEDDAADIDTIMRNIRELEHSQGGVFSKELASLSKMDGCSTVNG